jgi:hypothetical protein
MQPAGTSLRKAVISVGIRIAKNASKQTTRMIGIIGNGVEVTEEEGIENERLPRSLAESDKGLSWSGNCRGGPADHTTLPAGIDRPNEQGFSRNNPGTCLVFGGELAEQLDDLTVKTKAYHAKSLTVKVGHRGSGFQDSVGKSFGRKRSPIRNGGYQGFDAEVTQEKSAAQRQPQSRPAPEKRSQQRASQTKADDRSAEINW